MHLSFLKWAALAVGITALEPKAPPVNPDDWNDLAMDFCTDFYTLKGVPKETISLVFELKHIMNPYCKGFSMTYILVFTETHLKLSVHCKWCRSYRLSLFHNR